MTPISAQHTIIVLFYSDLSRGGRPAQQDTIDDDTTRFHGQRSFRPFYLYFSIKALLRGTSYSMDIGVTSPQSDLYISSKVPFSVYLFLLYFYFYSYFHWVGVF